MLFLAFILSILVGLCLGLLGGGGSILSVPVLVYVVGVEPHVAVASALVIVGVTAITGSVSHARAGRVRWKTALTFGIGSMAGAYPGGTFARHLSPAVLLGAFAALMFVTALAMVRGPLRAVENTAEGSGGLKLLLIGACVGLITGTLGAGGGFLIVPALVLFGHLPMRAALGTSLVIIAMNSFVALAGHLSHVTIDWVIVCIMTLAAVGGSLVGAAFVARIAAERLRRAFGWFVLSMAGFMLTQQAPPVLSLTVERTRLLAIGLGVAAFTVVLGVLIERARQSSEARTSHV